MYVSVFASDSLGVPVFISQCACVPIWMCMYECVCVNVSVVRVCCHPSPTSPGHEGKLPSNLFV